MECGARMAKKSRVRPPDDLDDDYEEEELEERPARRPRRAEEPRRRSSWLFWIASRLMVVVVLLAVLLAFAPWILGATGLWKPLLAWAAPDVAGRVEVASLRLGWISGLEASGVIVLDPAGQPLATLDRVASRKTLLQMALNQSDLGTFDAYAPAINVVLRADGSNVEDFLASLPKTESSTEPPGFALVVTAGSIALDDQVAGRKWQLDKVNCDFTWPAAKTAAKSGKLAAALKPAGEPADKAAVGEIAAEFSWQPGAGQAQVRLVSVPTEVAEGALRRFVSDIRSQGPLTLDASFAWSDDGKSQHAVVKQLAAPRLAITAPELLSSDAVTLVLNGGAADAEFSAGKLTVRDLRLDSNLVQLSGRGSAEMPAPTLSALIASLQTTGGTGEVEFSGQLDLAELARQLPGTLRLREGTEIKSGMVNASLSSRPEQGQRRWQGSLKTADLRATSAGRRVAFDQPMELTFSIRQTKTGPVIDELTGQSSFASLRGSGTLADGAIKADADLGRLAAEIGQLVDFGDTRLAGTLAANLKWNQDADESWKATADARIAQFEVRSAGLAPWREDDLQLTAEVTGRLGAANLERLHAGRLSVSSAGDRLEVELTEPVELSAAAAWPAKFTLRGELATWAPRVQPFLPLGDWRVAGAIDAHGSGRFAPATSELAATTVQVDQLAVDGPGLSIREPIVKIETSGAWDGKPQTLTLPVLTLASSSLAFRADNLRIIASPTEPSATGLIDFRGDLARLTSWIGEAGRPRSWQLAGGITGRVEIGYRGRALEANWMTDIEKLTYLTPPAAAGTGATLASASTADAAWEPRWVDERVSLTGQGTFDPASQKLQLAQANVVSSLATLAAAGTISEPSGACVLDLTGEVSYDLEPISQRLRETFGPPAPPAAGLLGSSPTPRAIDSLQLVGQEKRSFAIKGPLFALTALTPAGAPIASEPSITGPPRPLVSQQLIGDASLGWQGAQFVGLIAGKADVKAHLDRGVVNIGPLDIPLSEGRLTTAPRIHLSSEVPVLAVDRGPVLENVRISPEMCQLWLKYVAPILADTTRAEGKFSLSLQGAAIPLIKPQRHEFQPQSIDAAGNLAIHTAQIGPGPVAVEYLTLARQIRTLFDPAAGAETTVDPDRGWVVLPQQDVQFEVSQGAVRHRGFAMVVKDVTITTEGSVGIDDQSLNLIAHVPIQESWLKKAPPYLTGLKGKTLQIPIGGTITQPKIDGRILENLTKQLAGSAVQGVIDQQLQKGQTILQDELGKGLNRLFGPLQPKPPTP